MHFYLALVDQCLLERSTCDPIVFLVDAGLVDEIQYHRWRHGEGELCAALLCDEQEVTDALRAVQQYCARQKLFGQPLVPVAWDDPNKVLALGGIRTFTVLCSQSYSRSSVQRQADLFQDNASTVATQDTVRALTEHRLPAARESLERMKALGVADSDIAALNSLLEAVKWTPHVDTARRRLREMDERIVPTAQRWLADRANEFLSPLWGALAACLPGQYSTDDPSYHTSYAFLRGGCWQQLTDTVFMINDWQRQPVLIVRLIHGLLHLNRKLEARYTWSLLCWAHPRVASRELDRLNQDLQLRKHWQVYCDSDVDSGDADIFPAWLLLVDSHQRRSVLLSDAVAAQQFCASDRACKIYAAMCKLIANDSIVHRATLRECCPSLLDEYKRRVVAR